MLGRIQSAWAGFVDWVGPWRRWTHPRAKRSWAVLALLLYTLGGFFLAPWIAKRQIVSQLETRFERPVELESLAINPFLFSVDARGFSLTETDGAPIFAFDRFYARLRLSGVFRWAWSFAAIELDGADANVLRFADGRTNWGVLLSSSDDGEREEDVEADQTGSLPRVIIGNLVLTHASAHVLDQTRPTPFDTDIGPIDVTVKDVSTLPSTEGEQHVAVGFEDGGKLAWSGSLSLNPMASSGLVTASGPYAPLLHRYFQDATAFNVTNGAIVLSLNYEASAPAGGEPSASVTDADVALRDITLQMKQENAPFITVPELRLSGGAMAWPAQRVGADRLTMTGADMRFWRTDDGIFSTNLMMANKTPPTSDQGVQETDDRDGEGNPLGGWSFTLGQLDIAELSARLDDRSLREPGTLAIERITLSARDIASEPQTRSPFTLNVRPASGGELTVEGTASLLPAPAINAAFQADDLRVSDAQPYIADFANVSVTDGLLGFGGDFALSEDGGVTAAGALDMSALSIVEKTEGGTVIEAGRLSVSRYELDLANQDLQVSDITLDAPFIQLLVNEDSSTNIQKLLVTSEPADAEETPTDSSAANETDDAWRFAIGRIGVTGGSADFADRSLPFPFATEITEFAGEVTTLDSASADPARLDLQGQVGDYGLAQVDGALRPFDPTTLTDVSLLFRNIAIPDLSPYTIKFAGRRIARGRMDLDLNYAIDDGALTGENNIVITEIELGETVDQPGAMNLPLGLAIALLKNSEGVIDVDIPVRGDVTDPEFRVGGVIRRAIANVITSVVTSPFRMLGGLVGSDSEDFGLIEFEPGLAELTPPEREKLAKLAEALAQRPVLAVEVPGVWVEEVDTPRLQELRVEARLRDLIETDETGDELLLNRQRRDALERLFTEQFPDEPLDAVKALHTSIPEEADEAEDTRRRRSPRPELDEPAYINALRARLIEAEPITEADLTALADARAQAVLAALSEGEAASSTRAAALPARAAEATDQGWAPLELEVAVAEAPASSTDLE